MSIKHLCDVALKSLRLQWSKRCGNGDRFVVAMAKTQIEVTSVANLVFNATSHRWAAVCVVVGIAQMASAQTFVVDFETIPGMVNSPIVVPSSSRLTDQYLVSHNVRFSSTAGYAAVVELGTNHATSGTRGIGGSAANGVLSYAQANPVVGRFLSADGMSPYLTSFVSVRGDLIGNGGGFKTLRAYSAGGVLLGESVRTDADTTPLRVDAVGIHRFEIVGNAIASIAFDDVSYARPQACISVASQPQPRIACFNAEVSISVVAGTVGPFTYQWRRDGTLINTIANPSAATATLTLNNVQSADAGSYDCIVTNSCGSVTSNAATLTVCAGDINCDESVNFGDFLAFFNCYDTETPCADIDGNPGVDFGDFLAFFNAYDAGC